MKHLSKPQPVGFVSSGLDQGVQFNFHPFPHYSATHTQEMHCPCDEVMKEEAMGVCRDLKLESGQAKLNGWQEWMGSRSKTWSPVMGTCIQSTAWNMRQRCGSQVGRQLVRRQ